MFKLNAKYRLSVIRSKLINNQVVNVYVKQGKDWLFLSTDGFDTVQRNNKKWLTDYHLPSIS